MEAKIQKQVIDYFSCFEEFYNSSKTCLKECQNCALAINKLIIRCRKIEEAQLTGTPLDIFVGLQSKLITSLHNLISEEIREIRTNLYKVEEAFDKLCNKNKVFQETCSEIDFTEHTLLVRGTPLQPPLRQLLEFAEDTISFGSQVCAQIETSLNVLSVKGLKTESQADNLRISSDWLKRIPEIIAYTSFCSENQI